MTNFLIQKLKTDHNFVIASNGREALSRMEKLNALDLIISDVMLDEVDGFDFCKSVFDIDRYAHIPFIFLTAKAGPADRLKGLKLGAIDYIQKPLVPIRVWDREAISVQMSESWKILMTVCLIILLLMHPTLK